MRNLTPGNPLTGTEERNRTKSRNRELILYGRPGTMVSSDIQSSRSLAEFSRPGFRSIAGQSRMPGTGDLCGTGEL